MFKREWSRDAVTARFLEAFQNNTFTNTNSIVNTRTDEEEWNPRLDVRKRLLRFSLTTEHWIVGGDISHGKGEDGSTRADLDSVISVINERTFMQSSGETLDSGLSLVWHSILEGVLGLFWQNRRRTKKIAFESDVEGTRIFSHSWCPTNIFAKKSSKMHFMLKQGDYGTVAKEMVIFGM